MLEIPLNEKAEGENVPVEITLQFQKFKLEQKLQRVRAEEPVTTAKSVPAAAEPSATAQHKDIP